MTEQEGLCSCGPFGFGYCVLLCAAFLLAEKSRGDVRALQEEREMTLDIRQQKDDSSNC